MGRKSKFTKEIKIKAIKDYLNGSKSFGQIAIDLQCDKKSIIQWTKKYSQWGESIFDDKPTNSKYSKEFKIKVVLEYLSGEGSLSDLVTKYKIYDGGTLRNWILMYNNGIEIKDYDPKGEVYTMKARKTTLEERIEIVEYCLKLDKDYKETASKYFIPYSLVYQWVKRYQKDGNEGLTYNKKGPKLKAINPTTPLEILEVENAKLKRELERVNFENEVLKKKQYFEELLYSRKSNKKKNIKQ